MWTAIITIYMKFRARGAPDDSSNIVWHVFLGGA